MSVYRHLLVCVCTFIDVCLRVSVLLLMFVCVCLHCYWCLFVCICTFIDVCLCVCAVVDVPVCGPSSACGRCPSGQRWELLWTRGSQSRGQCRCNNESIKISTLWHFTLTRRTHIPSTPLWKQCPAAWLYFYYGSKKIMNTSFFFQILYIFTRNIFRLSIYHLPLCFLLPIST